MAWAPALSPMDVLSATAGSCLQEAGNGSVAFLPQALNLQVESDLPRQLLFFGGFAPELGDLGVDFDAALKCQALGRSGFGRRWRARPASQQRGAEPGQRVDQALNKGEEIGAGQPGQRKRLQQSSH